MVEVKGSVILEVELEKEKRGPWGRLLADSAFPEETSVEPVEDELAKLTKRAHLLYAEEKCEEAAEEFLSALVLCDRLGLGALTACLQSRLCLCWEQINKKPEALEVLSHTIPILRQCFENFGAANVLQGLKVDLVNAEMTLARILEQMGQHEQSVTKLQELIQEFPEQVDPKIRLADALLDSLGQTREALGVYDRVLEQAEDTDLAWAALYSGCYAASLHEDELALQYFNRFPMFMVLTLGGEDPFQEGFRKQIRLSKLRPKHQLWSYVVQKRMWREGNFCHSWETFYTVKGT